MTVLPRADAGSDLHLAHRMARLAGRIALSRFGQCVACSLKDDGSPVTDADRAVEDALLDVLAAARPRDGVLSEETGEIRAEASRRWILDPIDGTSSYLGRGRSWGTHIALEVDGVLRVAVVTRPTQRRLWWAVRGGGAFAGLARAPLSTGRRLSVSRARLLRDARVGGLVDPGSPGASALARHATWTDDDVSVIGALLEGRLDAVLDEGGDIWDQAPAALLVREAGGFFQDPHDGERVDLRWGLYGSVHLREQLLAALGLGAGA